MVNIADPPAIVLLQSDALIQARMARILAANSDLAPVQVVEDVIEMSEALDHRTLLLVVPVAEIDLALQRGETQQDLHLAVLNREVTLDLLEAMGRYQSFCHLVGWPDFLTVPQSWDLSTAAGSATTPRRSFRWEQLLPASSVHREWQLYSSLDRDTAIDELREVVRANLADDRLADTVVEVAYEMAMNAMYDAPIDDSGRPKYGHNRQQDIALENHEVPQLHFASDGNLVVLEIEDPFGRLKRSDVLEGIGRGLGAKTADRTEEILNTSQGGAGLGVFRMFQLATSLSFDVVAGQHTRVVAIFDLNLRVRDRRIFPTSLHFSFR